MNLCFIKRAREAGRGWGWEGADSRSSSLGCLALWVQQRLPNACSRLSIAGKTRPPLCFRPRRGTELSSAEEDRTGPSRAVGEWWRALPGPGVAWRNRCRYCISSRRPHVAGPAADPRSDSAVPGASPGSGTGRSLTGTPRGLRRRSRANSFPHLRQVAAGCDGYPGCSRAQGGSCCRPTRCFSFTHADVESGTGNTWNNWAAQGKAARVFRVVAEEGASAGALVALGVKAECDTCQLGRRFIKKQDSLLVMGK